MTSEEQIKLLEQKNLSLSRELDKVTNDLFSAQEIASDLKNQLNEKKHTEQLGGWAIDRAIETYKLIPGGSPTSQEIIETASSFCKWIMDASAAPILKKETMQ